MNWTAFVPLRTGDERKTRLAELLSKAERGKLADTLADHVLNCLERTPQVSRIIVISPASYSRPSVEWRRDEGAGLNAELTRACASELGPRLVIHGDLPLLTPQDVTAFIEAAESTGIALAPDRHDEGTNAVATGTAFAFAFGEGSFARHLERAGHEAAIVRRPGLAFDIDTPDDLDAAVRAGWRAPGT